MDPRPSLALSTTTVLRLYLNYSIVPLRDVSKYLVEQSSSKTSAFHSLLLGGAPCRVSPVSPRHGVLVLASLALAQLRGYVSGRLSGPSFMKSTRSPATSVSSRCPFPKPCSAVLLHSGSFAVGPSVPFVASPDTTSFTHADQSGVLLIC